MKKHLKKIAGINHSLLLPNFILRSNARIFVKNVLKISIIFTLSVVATSVFAAPRYKIIDLGNFPRTKSIVPEAVNNSGQFTGFFLIPNGGLHALYGDVHVGIADLNTLGGTRSRGTDINNSGQVVGYAETADGHRHAFISSVNGMVDLGTLGGANSGATAINDSGLVAGASQTVNGQRHAFIGDASGITDLGTLGGSKSFATAINDRGQAVGLSETGGGERHVFIGDADGLVDLGQPKGGEITRITDINSSGQVVGVRKKEDDQNKFARAFVTVIKNGSLDKVFDIPLLNGKNKNTASAINDHGQVVGTANQVRIIEQNGKTYHMNGHPRAFLYDANDRIVYDLNELVVNKKDWGILRNATGINNKGEIVGFGKDCAFLLVPLGKQQF